MPPGAKRLGTAGVIEALAAAMTAHTDSSVDLQIYGCTCFDRLGSASAFNLEMIQESKQALKAILNAVRQYRDHLTVLTVCGKIIGLGPNNALPPSG